MSPPIGAARTGTVLGGIPAGALRHIETQEASNSTSIDFTNVFNPNDGHDRYVVFIDNLIAGPSVPNFMARLSADGGSTWDSGSSDYANALFRVNDGGGTSSGGSSGADAFLDFEASDIGDDPASNDTSGFMIEISNPTDSDRATIGHSDHAMHRGATFKTALEGGVRLTQSAIDSIQFLFESGDIVSGIFSVYGVSQ